MNHPDLVSQWKCSICGVLKGPANHWFLYTSDKLCPFSFWPFEDGPQRSQLRVVCGEKCLHTALSQSLERVKNG